MNTQRPYHKYLTPFWVQREKEIEDSLNDPKDFLSNPYIVHAMVCRGGYPGGVNTQSLHLWRWQDHTKLDVASIGSFVEVGGGYGAMCRMIRGVNDHAYTIIDVPIINVVQRHFLRKEPNIDYCGLHLLESRAPEMKCEMFISCFAMSESSESCVELILRNKLFGAKHTLIAFYKEDTAEFKFQGYVPELCKYGDVVKLDDTAVYIMR